MDFCQSVFYGYVVANTFIYLITKSPYWDRFFSTISAVLEN